MLLGKLRGRKTILDGWQAIRGGRQTIGWLLWLGGTVGLFGAED